MGHSRPVTGLLYLYLYNLKEEFQCCSGDQTEKNEMGRACSTYRRQDRCIQDFGGEI